MLWQSKLIARVYILAIIHCPVLENVWRVSGPWLVKLLVQQTALRKDLVMDLAEYIKWLALASQ